MNSPVPAFQPGNVTFRTIIFLTICWCLCLPSSYGQIFSYTNDATGAPASVATNVTATSVARGAGVSGAVLACSGATDGFGADGWPSTSVFNVTTFNDAGEYVTFTVKPDCGYKLDITGLSARSRRENLTGTANDGPIALRYGYSTDGGNTWTIVNPGGPLSSNVCSSLGNMHNWNFVLSTQNSVIFRIYGLSSGTAGTGDLILRNITVSGTASPVQVVSCPASFSVCLTAGPVELVGGTPSGGTYSGDGVDEALFDPQTAGLGEHIITYSSSDQSGCTNTCTFSITVEEITIDLGNGFTTCSGSILSLDALITGSPTTLSWSDNGAGGTFSEPNAAQSYYFPPDNTGAFDVTLTLSATGICAVEEDLVVHYDDVLPPMTLSLNSDVTNANCGETVEVCVLANGGHDIYALQYDVTWDPSKFSLAAPPVSAPLPGTNIVTELAPGQLRYFWFMDGSTGVEMDEDFSLLCFTLNVIGAADPANIVLSEAPQTEATNLYFCNIDVNTNDLAIVLYPPADVAADNKAICSGASTELTVNNPNEQGGTFSWEAEYGDVTGGGGSATGVAFGENAINETLVNPSDEPIDVVYTLTPVGLSPGNCEGASIQVTVTVYPTIVFGFTASSNSNPDEIISNTFNPNTIVIDFCAGDFLTLSNYNDNGLIGFTTAYSTSGNITYNGSVNPIPEGDPVNIGFSGASDFFNQTYGSYGLYGGATFGYIKQTFTPYLDINENGALDEGECEGDLITLVYHIYAPIQLVIQQSPGSNAICSGDHLGYTLSTTSTENVTFDLILEDTGNNGGPGNNPADLNIENMLPQTIPVTLSSLNSPMAFDPIINNSLGSFDRGRVRIRAVNIRYEDADVCSTPNVVGPQTQVYPKPRLTDNLPTPGVKNICDGSKTNLDIDLLGWPSINAATAGYPVALEWTVVSNNVDGAANGSNVIYGNTGIELQVNDLVQTLSLQNPLLAGSATYSIRARMAGQGGFNANDCYGDYITVQVNVAPQEIPTIELGSFPEVCASPNLIVTELPFVTTAAEYVLHVPDLGINIDPYTALPSSPLSITIPDGTQPGIYDGTISVKNACGFVSPDVPFTITVLERPTAILSGDQTICSGGEANLTVTFTGSGLWNFFFSNETSYSEISDNPATITLSLIETQTFSILSLSDQNCTALPEDISGEVTITVNQLPDAVADNKAICSGALTELTVSNPNTFGVSFNWTAEYGAVTGGAGNGEAVPFGPDAINESLSNTTDEPITVIYTITPVGDEPTNCLGESITVEVIVYPAPVFGFSASSNSNDLESIQNTDEPALIEIDFCAGDFLTLEGYTANANIGYTMSYTTSGNILYNGSGPIADGSPQNIPFGDANLFFGQQYGSYGLSSGVSGTITQVFTPYLDVNSNNVLDAEDCEGDLITLVYHIYGPIELAISQTAGADEICSGDPLGYLFTTTAAQDVIFDLILEDNGGGNANPADLTAENGLPLTISITESDHFNSSNPYSFAQVINNATGFFDRGRVRVRAVNIRYANGGSCVAAEVVGPNTLVYPKPRLTDNLLPTGQKFICTGSSTDLDIDLLGLPTDNAANAGYPVRIEWTVVASSNVNGAANGTIGTYNNAGAEIQVNDIAQVLTLIDPLQNGTVTYSIRARMAGEGGFNANDCYGDPITVVIHVVRQEVPSIALGDFPEVCEDPGPIPTGLTYTATTATEYTLSIPGLGISIPNFIQLPASPIAFTVPIGTLPGVYQGVLTIRNACGYVQVENITVTVNPIPTVAFEDDITLCANQQGALTVNFTGEAPWTFEYSDGNNILSVTTSDNPFALEVNLEETTTFTIVSLHDANCTATDLNEESATATIVPAPNAAGTDKAICSGSSTALEITNPNELGGTFTWTASYGDVTGGAGSGSGSFGANAIDELLSNPSNEPIVVVYTITPVGEEPTSCEGTPIEVSVTVYPEPLFGFTATVNGQNPQSNDNTQGPSTIALDFCAGESFTFSGYNNFGIPVPMSFLEEITGGTGNTLYDNTPIPTTRPASVLTAGFFGTGPYGPYNLAPGETYGQIIQVFTPFLDVVNPGVYDEGIDCQGDPITLIYNIYAPIEVEINQTLGATFVCSGEALGYVVSTTSTEDVTLDLILEDSPNLLSPASLATENGLPQTLTVTINNLTPYSFNSVVNNKTGSFDRGRVRLRAENIHYADADVCTPTVATGPLTFVYPEPRLIDPADFSVCTGGVANMDLDILGRPSNRPVTAGYAVRIEWSLSAPGIVQDGLTGSTNVYNVLGAEVQVNDISQQLTLVNPANGPQTATFTITPRAAGANFIIDNNDCYGDPITVVVTVSPPPTAEIIVAETSGITNNDGIICVGASATLTTAGGTGYAWSNGATTAAITVSPTQTTTYTVTVTNANGCTAVGTQTITVNPLPQPGINVAETSGTTNNDGIICLGASATVTASGGTGYVWSNGANTAATTVSPTENTTYMVTVTNANGCTATATLTIIVNPLPQPSIAVAETSGTTNNDGTICLGASATLTASGGTGYVWSNGANTAATTVSPTETTTYMVTVTNANGCTATATQTIIVNPLPQPSIAVAETSGTTNNDGTICLGASATLTASGGTGYAWSNGANTAATTVSPTETTTYTVTVTNANGCTATATSTIIVNPLPQPSIAVAETSGTTNNDGTICLGASATLTASGGTGYAWSNGANTAATTVSPTETTTYTVTVTNASGCTATATSTIIVNPLPQPSIAVAETSGTTNNDGTICLGASATLTASGGTGYAWSNGANTAATTVSPTETTTYTVTVTNANGCTATTTSTIIVNPLPQPSIAVAETSGTTNNDGTICLGASATLTASGGTGYAWSNGANTAATTVSPTETTTYTVTVTNANGCTATATQTIIVNPLPQPSIAVAETSGTTNNDGTICLGASATLTASGGTGYAWSNGANTAATMVSPTETTTYTVTVTNTNGCTATATQTIIVNPLPQPSIAVAETSGTTNNDGTICLGASATLTASGGTGYAWSNGANTAAATVTPTETTTYTVTVTNANGCTATATQTIIVNPLPQPSISVAETSGTTNNDGIICLGASATLTASGGTGYAWSNGANTAATTVSPTETTTYTVTVTNANGCTATATQTIIVNPLPQPSIAVAETSGTTNNDGTICLGASATLTASGGTGYAWSNGANTAATTISPTETTTYTVTVTNANGCTATATRTIIVNPLPAITITINENSGLPNDGILCSGGNVSLTATGGGTYLWSTGATTAGIQVAPVTTTTYTVTVTNAAGCTASASTTISVVVDFIPPVWVTPVSALNTSVECSNAQGLLNAQAMAPVASDNLTGYTLVKSSGPFVPNGQCPQLGTYTNTWIAIDGCGNSSVPYQQLITIVDFTPPTVVAGSIAACYPTAAAAQAAAIAATTGSDLCSAVTKTAVVNGTCAATVVVTVKDCFGNTASATYNTRIDNSGPTLVEGLINSCYNTALEAENAAKAATTISDNCPGNLTVSAVTAGTCPATITVTVTDGCGNSSVVVYGDNGQTICIGSSVVNITTEASNQSVDCTNETSALSAWLANHGGAVASGMGIVWTNTTPNFILNCSTHSKTASVTFTATDNCGSTDQTTASFTVTDNVAPSVNAISSTNLSCITNLPAPNLNLLTGLTDNCDGSLTLALFSNTQNNGTGCPGNPLVLLRTYSVTDDYCNTTFVTHTINVVDNVPPTFTAPANTTVNVDANCSYNATTAVTGDVTNEQDNCSSGLNAAYSDMVVPGTGFQNVFVITRTWTLTDNCGNTASSQIQTITVKDVTPPTIVCPAPVTRPGSLVDNICTATIGQIDPVSYSDNCNTGVTISYTLTGATTGSGSGSASGHIFKEGETTVTYIATDKVGNTASCSFVVTVNCTTVSGKIIWEHNHALGVKDATVRLAIGNTQFGSTLSDVNGNYILPVPAIGNYTITPVKNINRLNGVTAADATAIQNHINGINIITDPYKKVAADVNRTGFITTQDVSLITQCLAGNPTALAIFNVFWRFTPTTYVMPVTAPNTVAAFPENIMLNITGPDVTGQDFYGMKIGDVNGSANPALAPTGSPLVWMLHDQQLQPGTEVELNFNATNFTDLAALQFALDFDPSYLQFEAFKSLDAIPMTEDNFGAFDAAQGELRVVWAQSAGITLTDGTPVISIKFKVLQGGKKLSDVLQLGDSYLPCKAYTSTLLEGDVRLVYQSSVATTDAGGTSKPQLVLYQNQPNPFEGATNIGFVLPGACDAKLRIMDASGRELTHYDRSYTAGYHEIEFRMENAVSYGILYYELITPYGTLSKKMVTAGK